jgi:DNA-binding MarR family transcriptional regulator
VDKGKLEVASTRLHSVAVRLLRRARAADREAPVGPAQLSALSVLYFQPRPIALTALAAIEQVTQPTMSRIVRSLAAAGAVRRSGTLADKRVLLVEISPIGRQIFEQAREQRLKLVREIVLQLEPDALLALANAVDALAQVLARPD